MKTNKTKTNKLKTFIKKNLYFAVLIIVLVSVLSVLTIKMGKNSNVANDANDNSVSTSTQMQEVSASKQPSFQLPVLDADVVRDYSGDEFINWVSVGYYATHQAVDFAGTADTKVLSIANGKVVSITNTNGEGTVVKISHDNGFVSVYGSLDSTLNVAVGDSVKKGAQIGTMSASMQNEAELGVHLHFAMIKDGKAVDPNLYLSISNK